MDIALALMIALGAAAADQPADPAPAVQTCRANGRSYAQGETACIRLPCSEPKLARCEMVLNNASWTKIADGCPTTALPGPRHGG